MKAFIPYALLGIVGATGAAVGTGAVHGTGSAPPTGPFTKPATVTDGVVRVTTDLDRTALPSQGGDAFVRVALEGVMPTTTLTERVPVSLTLIIDRSGSMSGKKMDDAKAAAVEAIASLQAGDKVCVVSFDDGADDHGCAEVGGDTSGLTRSIAALYARGSTDMVSGLRVGGADAGKIFGSSRVNRMLLLSDGRPDTESGLKDQVDGLAKSGITTTTLGLGADYNEDLMAGLADAGLGHYFFVDSPEKLVGIFHDELKSLSAVVARQAVVELSPQGGAKVLDVIGFRFDHSGDTVIIPAGDIYGGRVTDILVRLQTPAAEGTHDVVTARVRYVNAKTSEAQVLDRTLTALFTADANVVKASVVASVATKAEKVRAAQALLEANAAYDSGDRGKGDSILQTSSVRLKEQAAALAAPEGLADEAVANDAYKAQNATGGAEWRGVGAKAAKKRAWSMNKGSAY